MFSWPAKISYDGTRSRRSCHEPQLDPQENPMKFKDFDELVRMVKGKSNRIVSPSSRSGAYRPLITKESACV